MELFEYKRGLPDCFWCEKNIFIDAGSIIADGVMLGRNVSITNSVLELGVVVEWNSVIVDSHIEKGVKILSSIVEGGRIGENSSVGPFARIRKGTNIGNSVKIGNFVEVKNSNVGNGSKIAHLAYVGDADIGINCNVGCGVIFCNYDGCIKSRTVVGDNVFIGCNVNLVAPIKVGDNVYIAAGSTVTNNVDNDEFAIARSRQENKINFKNPYKKNKK